MNEKDYGILYEFLKPGIEKMYQYLYVSGNNVENYTDAVNAFDVFSKRNPEFIKAMVNSRQDFISSDREAAAFMMAFSGMYVPPNGSGRRITLSYARNASTPEDLVQIFLRKGTEGVL